MKILHVVENLNLGGLETVLVNLVTHQVSHNDKCLVVCLFSEGVLAERLINIGVDVIALHKKNGMDFQVLGRIRQLVTRFVPDVIHTHNAICNHYVVMATLFLGHKIINTRHGMGEIHRNVKGELLYKLSIFFTKKCVFVCKSAQIKFEEKYKIKKDKSVVIYNGIDLTKYDCSLFKKMDSSFKAMTGAAFVIGTVGRLNYFKDQATLIRAFRLVKKSITNIKLVIVGDGELRGELSLLVNQLQLGGDVVFLGARDDVNLLLCNMDMFVMTSISEGFSIALIEACAARLPIVTTDVGGNSEIIHHMTTGLLTRSGDAENIADHIITLVNSPETRKLYADSAHEWVANNATLEKMCAQYNHTYMS